MRRIQRSAGAILAFAPMMLLGARLEPAESLPSLAASLTSAKWASGLLALATVATLVGGVFLAIGGGRLRLGRGLVLLGGVSWLAHGVLDWLGSPAVVLGMASTIALAAHFLSPQHHTHPPDEDLSPAERDYQLVDQARGAALAYFGATLATIVVGLVEHPLFPWAAGLSLVVCVVTALFTTRPPLATPQSAGRTRAARLGLLGATALAAILVIVWRNAPTGMILGASTVPFAVLLLLPSRRGRFASLMLMVDAVLGHPARILVVTFIALSAFGGLLLRLPGVSTGDTIAPIDAIFTATSAVCVTGLIVLDTPVDFSFLGQGMILLLIQVGGLGIMSFSTVAIAALGRRLSLRHEAAMASLVSGHRGELFVALRRLLGVTFGTELVGALLLTIGFMLEGDGFWMALWRGGFTSVSAFCNAGFALQSASLVPYAESPFILHVVGLLIILGGLSPAVVLALPAVVRRQRVDVQVKIILAMTAGLLLLGTVLIGALEWSTGFAHLSAANRVHAAWFQSVTLRTAGFNSVDLATLHPATQWIMTALMIVGGSPGGTAGGIKTTTALVLMAAVGGSFRGRWEAVTFGRRISDRVIAKATAIVTVAFVLVIAGVMAVQITQNLDLGPTLFEVVSALATVGVSVGATAELDDVGKVIVMALMFVGRVGPLTLFLFLRERHSETPWRLPEVEIDVG